MEASQKLGFFVSWLLNLFFRRFHRGTQIFNHGFTRMNTDFYLTEANGENGGLSSAVRRDIFVAPTIKKII
jgi:hypothetical protein